MLVLVILKFINREVMVSVPVFSSSSSSPSVSRGVGVPPTDETVSLVARFFEALRLLKERRVIRGFKTFCDRYGINRRNFATCESHPGTGMFKLAWLTFLVRDYGVSADWLLVGRGVALPPLTGAALAKAELYKRRKAYRSASVKKLPGSDPRKRAKTANSLQI